MRSASPIVATLLLAAIAVAASIVLYSSVVELTSKTSLEETTFQIIILDAYRETPPDGAYTYYLHYYLPTTVSLNWADVFNYCKERGMFLPMPRNWGELNKLIEIIDEKGWIAVYTGLYQDVSASLPEEGWYYITNDPLEKNLWAAYEPSDDGGPESVSMVEGNYLGTPGLHDINGQQSREVICEKIGIGFYIRNRSQSSIDLKSLNMRIYHPEEGLMAIIPLNTRFSFEANVAGVTSTFSIDPIKCNRYVIPPGESARCSLQAIPFNVEKEPSYVRICLSGRGLEICDVT